jgi:branched-chain amino acid transport system permease protein
MAKSKAFVIGGIAVFIFLLLPQVANIGRYVLSLLVTLFIYIVLSESWNLLGGYAGQFNLGLAAYFGSGVLSCYIPAGYPLTWLCLQVAQWLRY